ncbi:MAG: DUF1330 domain-containing protein, partial [Luminiphilus sp.]|nr:DUF1330 domain-containing protein [Luminiphilus sp.]
ANKEQIRAFIKEDDGTPVHMVNLLKFKDKAEYEDGRETDLTGQQAYAIYSADIKGQIEKVGGQVVFEGQASQLLVGEVEDLWDMIAVVRYPNVQAMAKMTSDRAYGEIAIHRIAGLEGQLNIRTQEGPLTP